MSTEEIQREQVATNIQEDLEAGGDTRENLLKAIAHLKGQARADELAERYPVKTQEEGL